MDADAAATFRTALEAALARLNLPLTAAQLNQLTAHYLAMVETNRVMNLTRITDPADAAVKHYADSLALLAWARDEGVEPRSVLDIGTGAGFPAVPLAVARPDWSVTAIDSTGKKVDFLRAAAADLGLGNLDAVHAHTDHWRPGRRFDLVTFRALGPLGKSIRQAARFLAATGRIVAYKTTAWNAAEISDETATLANLGLRSYNRYEYELTAGQQTMQRALFVYGRKD